MLTLGLDPSFGFGGFAFLDVPRDVGPSNTSAALASIAAQDGKIVGVGTRTVTTGVHPGSSESTMIVSRLDADGSADPTFGRNGVRSLDVSSNGVAYDVSGTGIVVQPDGKIVVLGKATPRAGASAEPADFVVARLNADGSPDTGFGTSGYRLVEFRAGAPAASSGTPSALAIGADGKIVVVGSVITGFDSTAIAVARLNADGALDRSFDGDGVATVAFNAGAGGQNRSLASSVTVQPDGKVVVVGQADVIRSRQPTPALPTTTVAVTDIAVARLNPDGSLDPSFDGDGKLLINYGLGGPSFDEGDDVILQGSKVVIAGTASPWDGSSGALPRLTVTRLNPDGSLDPSFDGDGKFSLSFSQGGFTFSSSGPATLAALPDGSLLLGGRAQAQTANGALTVALARLSSVGSLDPGFGSGGVAILPGSITGGLLVRPDGKILYSSDEGVYRTTAPAPQVVATGLILKGTGGRARVTGMTIGFNTAVNPVLATRASAFRVRNAARGGRALGIRDVRYDATTFTVTINLRRPARVGKGLQVRIAAGGIVDAGGQVLNNGQELSFFVAPKR